MGKEYGKPNRLINEKSPYLLQHAYNPVDWYPWGEEAFDKARKENKPIFLSIGYSTCHWCHVMAHESFEDEEVARLMNRAFVCIKVDREERPDIDNIYMTVCQIILGRGGWPLNIIMTPRMKPFFAGTYIPKKSRFSQTGMLELVPRIEEIWNKQHEEVLDSAEKITSTIQNMISESAGEGIGESIIEEAYEELLSSFDNEYGGFERAPKFPTPHKLFFLLRYWRRSGNPEALHMVEYTLENMYRGGIHDPLGSGFHRYSTDNMWIVPHFEKMLYDQALIATAYTEAYQVTGKSLYREAAEGVLDYVLRDLTSPQGGFYCGEDADVEGEEGRYYLWTLEEIKSVLSPEDAELIIKAFNLKEGGNFEEEIRGRKTGTNILYLPRSLEAVAAELGIPADEVKSQMKLAKEKLLAARNERKRPAKDDKILTDWTGLMITAFAKGFQIFGEEKYLRAASNAADFILKTLYSSEKRLLHRYREGEAGISGTADDYAFLVNGLLDLYEAGFEIRYLKAALCLNKEFLEHFWDPIQGGLFFTADDSESLIFRKKEFADAAIPSGNSVEMLNLLRLARVTADPELEDRAQGLERAFSKLIRKIPSGYAQFLSALDFGLGPTYQVVIVGKHESPDTVHMLEELRAYFIPNKVLIFRPEGKDPEITDLAAYTKEQTPIEGKATAYVCQNYECQLPTTEVNEMLKMLNV
ncbi:thioredoxin domain-containing protein [Methanosarcina sp. MSH10X1]|uniref:thioredoxin domain-containing protein n=1 Tax=Methanosarcina sp. MSH10X1 TaxID=2507075 RepID=UPI000FFB4C2D|nr:thioredoxin domain-containing protein [Methanosarcina sp. MSH10X1]RXA19376.1 thioredoxin domain-containing protein [Methanosarcina sp. MSH10X1]